jgi:hypothetical protein
MLYQLSVLGSELGIEDKGIRRVFKTVLDVFIIILVKDFLFNFGIEKLDVSFSFLKSFLFSFHLLCTGFA